MRGTLKIDVKRKTDVLTANRQVVMNGLTGRGIRKTEHIPRNINRRDDKDAQSEMITAVQEA